jgi:hypothetical protein
MKKVLITIMGYVVVSLIEADASVSLSERLESAHQTLLEDRRSALSAMSDPFGVPKAARRVAEQSSDRLRANLPWKRNIKATVFWVGERESVNNQAPKAMSAWDRNWQASFGGYDHPEDRNGYAPAGFSPRMNPFYVALPYNDLGEDGVHRKEASEVIPWFWQRYRGDNLSVCKGRWLAIHHGGKVCYAQWEDVGPFETDHYQYVFGSEPPRNNFHDSAGIGLSPAVRDFLRISNGIAVEWRFAEDYEVPPGPWKSPSINR